MMAHGDEPGKGPLTRAPGRQGTRQAAPPLELLMPQLLPCSVPPGATAPRRDHQSISAREPRWAAQAQSG